MQLSWNRDEDGVITVYGTTTDGKIYDVADFWVTPMVERLGVSRDLALDWQQQHAELLVNTFNKIFVKSNKFKCPLGDKNCMEHCGNYGCGG